MAEQILQRPYAERPDPFQQGMQHVDGGTRVVQRTVHRNGAGVQHPGQRAELVVGRLVFGQHPAGQPHGVHHLRLRPPQPEPFAVGAQEPDVERGVMRHQHAAPAELQESGQHRVEAGRVMDHRLGDAGDRHDRGRYAALRIDQRGELAEHFATADLDGADLGHRVLVAVATGGLQVDDHEGHRVQRDVLGGDELVEGQLGVRGHRRSRYVRLPTGPVDAGLGGLGH